MADSILVTGALGFVGRKTAEALMDKGYRVVGVDNVNDYYDIRLKDYRLRELEKRPGFSFHRADIEDLGSLAEIFRESAFVGVINLAARAGVRYSMVDPFVYVRTNVLGTTNLLELCARHGVKKFVLASTSSLYAGQLMPFRESLPVNEPISAYAASKKGAEAMAYAYHHLYAMDVTVLRYFTVYGPAGRPDMSYFRFISLIDRGAPIEVFGDGSQKRDFTYIDDIAEGTVRALENCRGHEVINLGGNSPYELNYMISLIERHLGKKALRETCAFHKADMMATWADIEKARGLLGWEPKVSLEEGMERTVKWHMENREWLKDLSL
ncbi:MAG: NAD-dependent epimerase [Thermodesulfovibrionales bacterium]